MKKTINIGQTSRGFAYGEFEDRYGAKCSIQKSSLAFEDCIWLGVDDAKPQIMASQAKAFGVDTTETCGWVPYPVPKEVSLTTRMHLTQDMARVLAKQLSYFAKHGELPE